MTWQIFITPTARQMLLDIQDTRTRQAIIHKIDSLADHPELQGKQLIGSLDRYRSVRAAGQSYLIIYQIQDQQVRIIIVAVGIRRDGDKKDIYQLAQKLIKAKII